MTEVIFIGISLMAGQPGDGEQDFYVPSDVIRHLLIIFVIVLSYYTKEKKVILTANKKDTCIIR